jgi:hypothetical protein
MTDQHRAKPELWAAAEKFGQNSMDMLNCILELRARIEAMEARDQENANCWDMARSGMGALRERIEALEAAQLEQAESHRFCTDAITRRVEALEAPMTELRAASAEARPTVKDSLTAGGSLVERVEEAIITGMVDGDRHAARAAIREVAVWLRDRYPESPEAGALAFNLCLDESAETMMPRF